MRAKGDSRGFFVAQPGGDGGQKAVFGDAEILSVSTHGRAGQAKDPVACLKAGDVLAHGFDFTGECRAQDWVSWRRNAKHQARQRAEARGDEGEAAHIRVAGIGGCRMHFYQ